jgi:ABC-type sugar transport system ATPase subunit
VLIEMRGISKSFGGAPVLRDVTFEVQAGEVHVLAGENGAGKSTLMRILAGAETDFVGEILIAGGRASFRGPLDAIRAGIATIHQELSLVGPMSVADNLLLGREPGGLGRGGRRAVEQAATRMLAAVGLEVDPASPVESLPLATQQLVEIARALGQDARVLVMDEPTSALDDRDARLLFEQVIRLRERGKGVVYITHRMEEIYTLADRITVLRDGARVGTAKPAELGRDALVRWMAGEAAPAAREAASGVQEGVALEVHDLRVDGRVHGVSLTAQRGEIVGLAGLRGSGVTEVLHAVFGSLERPTSGRVTLGGSAYDARSPGRSIAHGMVLLPGDRQGSGLCPDRSVIENATLASLERYVRRGLVDATAQRAAVSALVDRFRLRVPSLDAPVSALSGGNQQKVCIARCALASPRVLLLDEPTRGVDVGAKADIHAAMRGWAREGLAIVVASSETEELLELCDPILVLSRGRAVARLEGAARTREAIVAAAIGHARATEARA